MIEGVGLLGMVWAAAWWHSLIVHSWVVCKSGCCIYCGRSKPSSSVSVQAHTSAWPFLEAAQKHGDKMQGHSF